jgi:hypothetical protein
MRRHHVLLVALLLAGLGLGLFLYKLLFLEFPLSRTTPLNAWEVEASLTFTGRNKSAKLSLFIPKTSSSFAIVDEKFISRGFGLTSTLLENGNRQAQWSARAISGRQRLYYHAVVRQLSGNDGTLYKQPTPSAPPFTEIELVAARAILEDIRPRYVDTPGFVSELFKKLEKPSIDDNVALLLPKKARSASRRAEVAAALLTLGNTPARVVHGIRLEETAGPVSPLRWLEVYHDRTWKPYDIDTKQPGIAANAFAWWRGDLPIFEASGVDRVEVKLAASPSEEQDLSAILASGNGAAQWIADLSLLTLPIEMQGVLRVLLLVPLGALTIVILRNVIGFKSFGTFMPVLIALAFRETKLAGGVLLYILIIGLGLGFRSYFARLKLLLVPRLAASLTVVILIMIVLTIMLHRLGLESGLSIALFPMVVLTMTIERMSIVAEERGFIEALRQGIGSLLAAIGIYVLFSWTFLEHLLFMFPELLLVVLGMTLLLGRYTGYRLLELKRFRIFAERI